MSKSTGMKRLRKEKRRLEAQIALEKTQIYDEVRDYANSLWPVKIINRFRKTAESFSENKLLVIGAQLLFSALNTAKGKSNETKESSEEKKEGGGIKDFLKSALNNFLQQYMNKKEDSNEE